MTSIDHYNQNAEAFYERTIGANLDSVYEKFLRHLSPKSSILDAGCGVGRDSKYFLNQGHLVTAFDGSKEMARMAARETGKNILCLTFEEIDFSHEFDAVWANASLLHVPESELRAAMQKLHKSLKPSGLFYASFKYGDYSRQAGDRHFTDMNEERIAPYLEELFTPLDIWKATDTRSRTTASPYKEWLHLLCRAAKH